MDQIQQASGQYPYHNRDVQGQQNYQKQQLQGQQPTNQSDQVLQQQTNQKQQIQGWKPYENQNSINQQLNQNQQIYGYQLNQNQNDQGSSSNQNLQLKGQQSNEIKQIQPDQFNFHELAQIIQETQVSLPNQNQLTQGQLPIQNQQNPNFAFRINSQNQGPYQQQQQDQVQYANGSKQIYENQTNQNQQPYAQQKISQQQFQGSLPNLMQQVQAQYPNQNQQTGNGLISQNQQPQVPYPNQNQQVQGSQNNESKQTIENKPNYNQQVDRQQFRQQQQFQGLLANQNLQVQDQLPSQNLQAQGLLSNQNQQFTTKDLLSQKQQIQESNPNQNQQVLDQGQISNQGKQIYINQPIQNQQAQGQQLIKNVEAQGSLRNQNQKILEQIPNMNMQNIQDIPFQNKQILGPYPNQQQQVSGPHLNQNQYAQGFQPFKSNQIQGDQPNQNQQTQKQQFNWNFQKSYQNQQFQGQITNQNQQKIQGYNIFGTQTFYVNYPNQNQQYNEDQHNNFIQGDQNSQNQQVIQQLPFEDLLSQGLNQQTQGLQQQNQQFYGQNPNYVKNFQQYLPSQNQSVQLLGTQQNNQIQGQQPIQNQQVQEQQLNQNQPNPFQNFQGQFDNQIQQQQENQQPIQNIQGFSSQQNQQIKGQQPLDNSQIQGEQPYEMQQIEEQKSTSDQVVFAIQNNYYEGKIKFDNKEYEEEDIIEIFQDRDIIQIMKYCEFYINLKIDKLKQQQQQYLIDKLNFRYESLQSFESLRSYAKTNIKGEQLAQAYYDANKDFPFQILIRGDGNCFYRSFMLSYIYSIFIQKNSKEITTLFKRVQNLKDLNYKIDNITQDQINLSQDFKCNFLQFWIKAFIDYQMQLSQNNIYDLQSLFKEYNNVPYVDAATVILCRNIILEKFNQLLTDPDYCYFITEEAKEQSPKYLLLYGQEAEDVIIPIAAKAFGVDLKVKNIYRINQQIFQDELMYKNEQQIESNIIVSVLFTKGHYNCLFTKEIYSLNQKSFIWPKFEEELEPTQTNEISSNEDIYFVEDETEEVSNKMQIYSGKDNRYQTFIQKQEQEHLLKQFACFRCKKMQQGIIVVEVSTRQQQQYCYQCIKQKKNKNDKKNEIYDKEKFKEFLKTFDESESCSKCKKKLKSIQIFKCKKYKGLLTKKYCVDCLGEKYQNADLFKPIWYDIFQFKEKFSEDYPCFACKKFDHSINYIVRYQNNQDFSLFLVICRQCYIQIYNQFFNKLNEIQKLGGKNFLDKCCLCNNIDQIFNYENNQNICLTCIQSKLDETNPENFNQNIAKINSEIFKQNLCIYCLSQRNNYLQEVLDVSAPAYNYCEPYCYLCQRCILRIFKYQKIQVEENFTLTLPYFTKTVQLQLNFKQFHLERIKKIINE